MCQTTSRSPVPLVLLLALTLSCSVPSRPEGPSAQWYRAHVATEAGDEIPFFLEVPANCNTGLATIANGVERIPVACQRFGSRLVLDFPVYGRRISADESGHRELAGHWEQTGGASARQRLRFGASPLDHLDPTRRFAVSDRSMVNRASGPGAPDVSGVWRMGFGVLGTARGTFEQDALGVVRGTIEVPAEYGDLRFLAGTVDSATLSLSTFDGGHGYLVQVQLDDDGSMQGDVLGTDGVRHAFSAVRSEDFEPADPLRHVIVTSEARRLDFAPLFSPQYAGKAVILELFGTWCSNCNDLAPLLTELYRNHREAGLAIIGLAFEVSDDQAFNRDRLAAYRAKHGLDWEVIFADGSPDETFSVGPAKLSPISGVPVTIFLNRDRTIQAIYTGFRGPATGAAHHATVVTFRRLTREILNNSGDAAR